MLKFWLIGGLALLLVGSIVGYATVCHGRGIKLAELEQRQAEWLTERSALNRELASRNQRIRDMNQRLLESLEREQRRIERALAEAERIRRERDAVAARLAEALAGLQEEGQHDDELAAWLPEPVPAAAWRGLRDIASDPP